MNRVITQRQREVYQFLKQFIEKHGYSPTIRDIARRFGFSSPATVHKYLVALERAGLIARGKRNALVQLIYQKQETGAIEVPLAGKIAAGRPIEAIRSDEMIAIPPNLLGKRETYALRVVGNSMIEEHIRDGDIIIVEARETAENGQTVVALIEDNEVTVKKLYREKNHIRLQPANESLQPIFVDPSKVRIQGVVIAVIRKY